MKNYLHQPPYSLSPVLLQRMAVKLRSKVKINVSPVKVKGAFGSLGFIIKLPCLSLKDWAR